MSKRARIGTLVLSLAFVGVAAFVAWPKPPEAERAAVRALECTVRGDADGLFDLATPDERTAYHLDREGFRRLWREYVSPAFGSLRPTGETQFDRNPAQQTCVVSREFVGGQGQSVAIGFIGAKTDEGGRAPGLITSLLLSAGQARHAGALLTHGPERKLEVWARQAKEDAEALTALGIAGIYRTPSEGLVSWSAWLAHCEARLEQIRSAKAAPRPN